MVKVLPYTGVGYDIDKSCYDISDLEFDEIAQSCKVSILTDMRSAIRGLLLAHLNAANRAVRLPSAEPIMDFANSFVDKIQALLDQLQRLEDADELDIFRREIIRQGASSLLLYQSSLCLSGLSGAVEKAQAHLLDAVRGGPGTAPVPHFKELVWHLAYVFEALGGKASGSYNPSRAERRGPFVRFVTQLTKGFPSSFLPKSIGDRVYEALEQLPKEWDNAEIRKRALFSAAIDFPLPASGNWPVKK